MKWRVATPDPAHVSILTEELGVTPFLAALLVERGVPEPVEARRFLEPKLSDFESPLPFPGVEQAVDRILTAVREGQRVVIFGDYDVDGISSVALMLTFFKDLGFAAGYMLPSRFSEGYGLGQLLAEELAQAELDLVITVDCGTSSHDEVTFLVRNGVDIVVTDHHGSNKGAPPATAFVNPSYWEGDLRKYSEMAGVGVAFLVLMGLYIKAKADPVLGPKLKPLKGYLDLVTLGTVADLVPLTGKNRALVVHGLKLMESAPLRPGLLALRDVLPGTDRRIDASTIAFYMAPRLNAAGRMGSAEAGVELLMSSNHQAAMGLARTLETENARRKELDQQIFEEADVIAAARLRDKGDGVLVLASDQWHKGVLGIVAARLAEKHHRPAFLLTVEDGIASGSGRSVAGFHLREALAGHCSDLLTRFGGHSMAAGVSLAVQNVPELEKRLDAVLATLSDEIDSEPTLSVDQVVPLRDVTQAMILDLERLAPYGSANPEPVIAVEGVKILARQVTRGDHLKLVVEQEGRKLEVIGFRMGDLPFTAGDVVDLAFFPEYRTYQGQTFLQLRLKDMKRHGGE